MLLRRALFRGSDKHSVNIFSIFYPSNLRFSNYSTHKFHTNDKFKVDNFPVNSDGFTLVQMIRNCTNNGHVSHGEQLHCYILRSGSISDLYVSTNLVTFYAKTGRLDDAGKLFDEMPQRNVVSWNVVISGYVRSGKLWTALSFFNDLNNSDILADAYSFTSALAACGLLSLLQLGMLIHSRVIVCGLELNVVVANCLIDMYGKCGSVQASMKVFDGLWNPDLISWNSVIAACARNQRLELAFDYFHQMPNPDIVTYNELINGVSRFGNIDEAIQILKSMPESNSSSWNAVLSGYVAQNRAGDALDFFTEMQANGVAMDDFTFSSIVSGIASISALIWGAVIHCYVTKHGLITSMMVGSALIDMYSKCGQVKDAEMVFRDLPYKSIVTWNALISGLARNGESMKVVKYFEELKDMKGMKPDDITFVNVLAACSHNQMPLEKAYEYLTSMVKVYGIRPKAEHLASMIRLMEHHGQLRRAEKMIHELGFGSCIAVWRALLGACGASGNLAVAKVAVAKLLELADDDELGYVILSNINKVCGNWDDATAIWESMKEKKVIKDVGFSCVQGR